MCVYVCIVHFSLHHLQKIRVKNGQGWWKLCHLISSHKDFIQYLFTRSSGTFSQCVKWSGAFPYIFSLIIMIILSLVFNSFTRNSESKALIRDRQYLLHVCIYPTCLKFIIIIIISKLHFVYFVTRDNLFGVSLTTIRIFC